MTGFPGFSPAAVEFLRALKGNNNRDWFTENKATYESELKTPAKHFCDAMSVELEDLTGLPHRSKVFRINRDLRFSKDKTPYNAHLHILFAPEGREDAPGWFFALQTDKMMLGTGVFGFSKPALEAYRKHVATDDTIGTTIDALRDQGIRVNEPELKRVPPGYPADHPRADLLRNKGLHVWVDHPDPMVAARPDMLAACRHDFERVRPLFDLLLAL